jgi:small-conductance mechanosensitive channel
MTMSAMVACVFNSRLWAAANWDQMWRLAAISLSIGVGWHTFATSQWVGYRRLFAQELRHSYGQVEFETTDLAREQYGQQSLRAMTFLWELPHQSILWSHGEVTAILYSNRMMALSEMLGRREIPELAEFDRFIEPSIVP